MKSIVGKNLKSFRESFNYKQIEVSSYLGVDRGAYANYESGNREMPYDLMEKICELYGIALVALFDEDARKVEENLLCAFRTDNLCSSDIKEVALFKEIVRDYLKMCNY